MRLETPVIYFYPPDDKPITLDVSATFNGGLLTEFYPNALERPTTAIPLSNPPDGITANTHTGGWNGTAFLIHKLPPPIVSCAPPQVEPRIPRANHAGDRFTYVWLAPQT